MTKTCTKCGETKPLSEFHRAAKGKDGTRPDCKMCVNAQHAAYRRDHPGKAAAWNAKSWNAKYKQGNPDKVAASQAA
jgi:hypothetical protein